VTPNLLAAVRRLARPDELTDAELLGRFARARDGGAFRALVDRHGPMVLAVCRRLLGYHDADDAFQAAFLVLARKAGSLRVCSVGDWLFGVARRTALAARRAEIRRRRREAKAVAREKAPPEDHRELRQVLDEELARLPAKYREILVLSDLQEKDRRQVAVELGIPEGTVASRLSRARALLASRLTRRGWGLPAYLLVVARGVIPLTVGGGFTGWVGL
jgi:RNA polymerase sigma factor (sigma-70 family)